MARTFSGVSRDPHSPARSLQDQGWETHHHIWKPQLVASGTRRYP